MIVEDSMDISVLFGYSFLKIFFSHGSKLNRFKYRTQTLQLRHVCTEIKYPRDLRK